MERLRNFVCALIAGALLSGCAALGIENPFPNDPLTGGVDASASNLLGVPIPAGLQRYPSHGYVSTSSSGAREGLETYRGNIDGKAAALNIFGNLRQNGWNLRLSLQYGYRSVALYQKNDEYAIVTFHRQGLLTILEIWAGTALPDGAELGENTNAHTDERHISLPGEEYGPLEDASPKPQQGTVEQWGGKLEEREL